MPLLPPVDDFRRVATALDKLQTYQVSVSVATVAKGRKFRGEFAYAMVSPEKQELRVRLPRQNGLDRIDRAFRFVSNQVTGYDVLANEVLQTRYAKTSSPKSRIQLALGALDDGLRSAVAPKEFAQALRNFGNSGRWTQTKAGILDGVVGGRKLRLELAAGGLPKRLSITSGAERTDWSYRFTVVGAVVPAVSPTAMKVKFFVDKSALPIFADAKSEQIIRNVLNAHKTLRATTITIGGTGAAKKVYIGAGQNPTVGEDADGWQWRLRPDGALSVVRKSPAKNWSGKVARAQAQATLKSIGVPGISGYMREWLQRRVPFRDLLDASLTGRKIGEIQLAGKTCDLISFNNKIRSMTFAVQRSPLRLVEIDSETRYPGGKVLDRGTTTFRYGPLSGENLPATGPKSPLPSAE